MTNIGKAYGFFDCRASKEEIEAEIPTIRKLVQTPSELELSLMLNETFSGPKDLASIAREAREAGVKYVIEATYPDRTNKQTAQELGTILNQAYQSPLYQEGEQFKGQVVYGEGNEYRFSE